MAVRQESELLRAALGALGLAVRSRNNVSAVCDSGGREYRRFRGMDLDGDKRPPVNLSDFLSIRYFEHYSFPDDYKIIDFLVKPLAD